MIIKKIILEVVKSEDNCRNRKKIDGSFAKGFISRGVWDYAFHLNRLYCLIESIDKRMKINCPVSLEEVEYSRSFAEKFREQAYGGLQACDEGLFDRWISSVNYDYYKPLIEFYEDVHKDILNKLKKFSGEITCQN